MKTRRAERQSSSMAWREVQGLSQQGRTHAGNQLNRDEGSRCSRGWTRRSGARAADVWAARPRAERRNECNASCCLPGQVCAFLFVV